MFFSCNTFWTLKIPKIIIIFFLNCINYQFSWVCNDYGPAMRILTKLINVPLSDLWSVGLSSVDYVNDCYLQRDTYKSSLHSGTPSLGFITPREISYHLEANQRMLRICYMLYNITPSPTDEKKPKIKELQRYIFTCNRVTVRKFAELTGNLIASFLQ